MTNPIVAHARTMIGTPWRHRGRSAWAVDCVGLLVASLRAAGVPVADRSNYGREPWKDGLREEMRAQFGEPVTDWQPGDVALMRWRPTQEPSHVGIIGDHPTGGLSLIHAYSMTAVTEHAIDNKWRARIVEVYRPWRR